MTSVIRFDRLTEPWWYMVPEEERTALEAQVPRGYFVTVLARTGVTDLTARLFRGTTQVRMGRAKNIPMAVRSVLSGCFLCGRESEMRVTVDGEVREVCDTCYQRSEVQVPLDYTEDPDREC